MLTLGPLTASQNTSFGNAQKFLEHPCFDNIQTFKHFDNIFRKIIGNLWKLLGCYMPVKTRTKKSHTFDRKRWYV